MFKKVTLGLGIFVATTAIAAASGFGANLNLGGQVDAWSGNTSGYASSATNGGSMAQGNVNNTGVSAQFTQNAGGGHAYAGAQVGHGDVVTYSGGGSHAANVSAGFTGGQAAGSTAGAVGTDFTGAAFGSFESHQIGANLDIWGGFGTF